VLLVHNPPPMPDVLLQSLRRTPDRESDDVDPLERHRFKERDRVDRVAGHLRDGARRRSG
jgi:hypothetical protein